MSRETLVVATCRNMKLKRITIRKIVMRHKQRAFAIPFGK
jgi:uncharacterized protein YlxP (DUF503 family)